MLGNVLLQCTSLISKLSDLLEQDTNFARECFAKVVQIPGRSHGWRSGWEERLSKCEGRAVEKRGMDVLRCRARRKRNA